MQHTFYSYRLMVNFVICEKTLPVSVTVRRQNVSLEQHSSKWRRVGKQYPNLLEKNHK